jgi:hypothetical protein
MFAHSFVKFYRYREDDFKDNHAAPYQVLLDTGGFIYSPSKTSLSLVYLFCSHHEFVLTTSSVTIFSG